MFARLSPALVAFGGSVLLLTGLIGALYYIGLPTNEPLEVYCAAAMRLPMEEIVKDYEVEHGQAVVLHFGPSQEILTQLELTKSGDLFLPADESYVELAEKKGLVSDIIDIAALNAVVIVNPKVAKEIKTWADFLSPGLEIGLASPESAAIGKLTKQELQKQGLYAGLEARKPSYIGDVNHVGNSVAVGSSHIGITWDALAEYLQKKNPGLKIVRIKELESVQARVKISLAKCSKQPSNALAFMSFVCDQEKGGAVLKKFGYSPALGPPLEKKASSPKTARPELVVYAGSMLRPAVEQSLDEFEKLENVRITRVYNGCGILVGQMKVGVIPDIYFACDTTFMTQVQEKFGDPKNISNNQLMIIVKKGNPHAIAKLLDLGKDGLKVGVGHEHQCALGALTRETFIRTGVYAKVMKNVVEQAPSGDLLVSQMRAGALDVVVAYRSNMLSYANELDGIPITNVQCATPSQPIAVSKSSAHPELSRKLSEFLQRRESRDRFEKLGFGWEVKEVELREK